MSNYNNSDYVYHGDLGNSDYNSSLPIQTIPVSMKNDKWKKSVMDTLENIGIRQLVDNRVFSDYRKMAEGRLIYQDFDDTDTSVLDKVRSFRKEHKDLPTFLKHFDIIGVIINQLAGEYDKQRDILRVDSIDNISRSEFFREKNLQIRDFTEEYFKKTVEIKLLERGFDPNKSDFNSEEEQQQYLQRLQQERDRIVPPEEIERGMKDYKTIMTEWAEKTMEANYINHDLSEKDMTELVDYLSTGRYFRNFYVGYDYYRPETWSVEKTFFSQDINVVYPQDCEYAGKIDFYSGAEILERFGHMIPQNIQKKLYGHEIKGHNSSEGVDFLQYLQDVALPTSIPYASFFQEKTAHSYQNLTGIPMGKTYFINDEEELEGRYSWVENSNSRGNIGGSYGHLFRDDIAPRIDLIQVTEAYFRSQKMMGLLTLNNPYTNEPYQTEVDEDLLKDLIKEYGIKNIRTVSLKDASDNPEPNTIAWFFVPQVWTGYKLNAGNTKLQEDYYFGVEPLPYQIRGDSNLFDVKLPLAGIITSGIAQKIRPYQIEHNIVMNQIRSLLEKELGTFFMIDYNFLPSQYKDETGETTEELLTEWREQIREIGFGLTDYSLRNTKGQNPNQNTIQQYDISFNQQIQTKMALAEFYKNKAYEQIGITQQRVGNPNEYETTEGVKQGVNASYAQTERIYKRFNAAKRREKVIELSIAQNCVKDNKDITVDYLNPDGERILKKFSDEDFWLRKINITPINDSQKRRELENFRQMMLQNNTMNNDLLDLATIVTSDSFTTLLELGRDNRKKAEEKLIAERQQEQQLLDKKLKAEEVMKEKENAFKAKENQLDREAKIAEAKIEAAAEIADNNFDQQYFNNLLEVANREEKKVKDNATLDIKSKELELKEDKNKQEARAIMNRNKLEFEKLKEQRRQRQLREKEMYSNEYIARENKN